MGRTRLFLKGSPGLSVPHPHIFAVVTAAPWVNDKKPVGTRIEIAQSLVEIREVGLPLFATLVFTKGLLTKALRGFLEPDMYGQTIACLTCGMLAH